MGSEFMLPPRGPMRHYGIVCTPSRRAEAAIAQDEFHADAVVLSEPPLPSPAGELHLLCDGAGSARSILNQEVEPEPGVYDRTFRIENRSGREMIRCSIGDLYCIEQDPIQGFVDDVRIDAETIRIGGWAVEPCLREPARTIAVFLGNRFVGYAAMAVRSATASTRSGVMCVHPLR
jgi:hypothetical protein